LENGEYATARAEVERFFWSDLCDNYLELAKARLYSASGPEHKAAQWTMYQALLTSLKLFAPYLPYVTEKIYQELFRSQEEAISLHTTAWPNVHTQQLDAIAEEVGRLVLELLRQVRRYKAEQGLSVGVEMKLLHISLQQNAIQRSTEIETSLIVVKSATRAQTIVFCDQVIENVQGMTELLVELT